MSPTDALISSENCSEGPGGGADEPANQPAWSRSDYTYKAMKAPAVHRVQGWGRRAGLCRAVWEGAVHRTHCGVGRRREAHEREAAPPPALRPPPSVATALLGSAFYSRPPAARAPPPRLPHGPPVLGAATPSLPLIWPRNRRAAAAQREGKPHERGREGGGALGSSCGERASLFLLQCWAWPPAVYTLPPHSATASPLVSPRVSAPLGAQGYSPRHRVPHLASARHYSPGRVGSHSLPCPGPNSSAEPLRLRPLHGPRRPRRPALSSRTGSGEPQCRLSARSEPKRKPGSEQRRQGTVETIGAGGAGD